MSNSTSPAVRVDGVDSPAQIRRADLLVRTLTPGYERDVSEHGRDEAFHKLDRRLWRLERRGVLGFVAARQVSHRVRYADVLARFDPEIVDDYRARLRFAVGPAVHRGVPPGTYALPVVLRLHQGNDLVFYRVWDFGSDERMAGYRYVRRQAGTKETFVPRRQIAGVFRRIAEFGPEASAKLWRGTIGACEVCGATLTNLQARAVGQGPWCRHNRPDDEAEQVAAQRIADQRKQLRLIDGGRP